MDATPWIENLSEPLILAGFVIFIFSGLFKLLKTDKLTRDASKGLLHKGLNFFFILGLSIIVLGFATKFMQLNNEKSSQAAAIGVIQTMSGTSGTAIQSGGNSNINQSQDNPSVASKNNESVEPPRSVSQTMQNTQGTAIQSGQNSNSSQSQ